MAGCATAAEVLDWAVRLLSRRDYSAEELRRKLQVKTQRTDWIDSAIEKVQSLGYQSDQRFCESFIRYAAGTGKGPIWLRYQLQSKGVDELLAEQALAQCEIDWQKVANETLARRFHCASTDAKQQAKQYRMLANRGFPSGMVRKAMELLPQAKEDSSFLD